MATFLDTFERSAVNTGSPVQYSTLSGSWDINAGSLRNTSGSTCVLRPDTDVFTSADQSMTFTMDDSQPTTQRFPGLMLRVTGDALLSNMDGYYARYEAGGYQLYVVTNNTFTALGTTVTEPAPTPPFDLKFEVEGSTLRFYSGPVGGPYVLKRQQTESTHTAGRRFAVRCVTTTNQRLESLSASDLASSVANAGPDQSVDVGELVTLDGTGSQGATSYLWSKVSGPTPVSALSSTSAASPTYTPNVAGIDVWQLQVPASGAVVTTDTVQIFVGTSTFDIFTGVSWVTRPMLRFDGTGWV